MHTRTHFVSIDAHDNTHSACGGSRWLNAYW